MATVRWRRIRGGLNLLAGIALAVARLQAGEEQLVQIKVEPAAAVWSRPAVSVPELPAAPTLDGQREAAVWAAAAPLALRYATGSHQPEAGSDARAWIGHTGGILYLLIEFDWPAATAPKMAAQQHDQDIWRDDSVEIFLAPSGGLDRPVQVTFNWAGVRGDTQIVYDLEQDRTVKQQPEFNPAWQVACARGEGVYRAEVALPLKGLIGVAGTVGDVLRLDVVRNRVDGKPPELHWAAIEGDANCRPDYFGFAVLADKHGAPLALKDLHIGSRNEIVIPERRRERPVLRGQPAVFKLLHPLAECVSDSPWADWQWQLRGSDGQPMPLAQPAAVAAVGAAAASAVRRVTVAGDTMPAGRYTLQVRGAAQPALDRTLAFSWQDCVFVPAVDADAVVVTGRTRRRTYPRTVGREVLSLAPGARAQFQVQAVGPAGVAVCLPISLPIPGPQVGSPLMQKLRCRVDDGAWRNFAVAEQPQEIILAATLPAGEHTVTVEPVDGELWLAGFRISAGPMSRVHGLIHSHCLNELLTDVRAEIAQNGRVVRTEYVRSPHNGTFEILGLPPGDYTVTVSAVYWEPVAKPITIAPGGAVVDLGVLVLGRRERLQAWNGETRPRYGHTVTVAPGGEFTATVPVWDGVPRKVLLVSRFRTVELAMTALSALPYGRHNKLAQATFTVPAGTPLDMYDMQLQFDAGEQAWADTIGQAVCVRANLPEQFFLAGCGHMNTWGQQTAEYLRRVGEIAQLAGARELLVANEVNPAYVSGALGELRVPYVTCSGNHTVGRWDEFFGAQPRALSDGPLRIVSFGRYPYESWAEAERLLRVDPAAGARVVVCFEGFAPIAVVRQAEIDLLFDGHSDNDHPAIKDFPAGTLQMRAPTQESLRWMPMNRTGLAVATVADCPVLPIPRDQPSPLRVELDGANDGTARRMTARLVNEFETGFDAAQVRLVMAAGKYAVTGALVVQQFDSDDHQRTVVDVAVQVGPKSVGVVKIEEGK